MKTYCIKKSPKLSSSKLFFNQEAKIAFSSHRIVAYSLHVSYLWSLLDQ